MSATEADRELLRSLKAQRDSLIRDLEAGELTEAGRAELRELPRLINRLARLQEPPQLMGEAASTPNQGPDGVTMPERTI